MCKCHRHHGLYIHTGECHVQLKPMARQIFLEKKVAHLQKDLGIPGIGYAPKYDPHNNEIGGTLKESWMSRVTEDV